MCAPFSLELNLKVGATGMQVCCGSSRRRSQSVLSFGHSLKRTKQSLQNVRIVSCLCVSMRTYSVRCLLMKVKRKWQKIVNKGLECGHRSVTSSADASTIVFDGIKEGVQGVSRLLSARFSYTPPPSSYPTVSTQSGRCLPSSLNKYHCAQESNSSISTYMTSRSDSMPGRSSQSSMSSFGEDRRGALEENLCLEGERKMDDSHGNGESQVQVLMVRDTGATPTMSPNPEFHQQKQRRDQDNCVSASLSTLRLNDANIECVKSTITGDFKGQLRTCDIQATAVQAPGQISREAQFDLEQLDFSSLAPSVLPSSQGNNAMCTETSLQPVSSPSLSYVGPGGSAPISSIPGFGLTAGVATVPSPPVFSWMDNVGKKLKELQKSSACVVLSSISFILDLYPVTDLQRTKSVPRCFCPT